VLFFHIFPALVSRLAIAAFLDPDKLIFLANRTARNMMGLARYCRLSVPLSTTLCIVTNRYILLQKFLNRWTGSALRPHRITRFYNFQPLRRPWAIKLSIRKNFPISLTAACGYIPYANMSEQAKSTIDYLSNSSASSCKFFSDYKNSVRLFIHSNILGVSFFCYS